MRSPHLKPGGRRVEESAREHDSCLPKSGRPYRLESDLCLRNLSDSSLAGEGCSLAGSSAQSPKAGASLGGGRGEGTEDGGG